MKSIRLTQYDRKNITRQLLIYRFNEKENKILSLFEEAKLLAEEIYNDGMGAANLKQIAKIPEGWLLTRNYMQVSFPSASYIWMYFDGSHLSNSLVPHGTHFLLPDVGEKIEKSFPADRIGCFATYDVDHAFTTKYNSLKRRAEAVQEEIETAHSAAMTALNSVSSTSQLLELWPEIEPFVVDRFGKDRVVRTLALPKAELNQILELPKLAA